MEVPIRGTRSGSNLLELLIGVLIKALGKLVTKIDKKYQKQRLIFVIHYRTTVFLLTLTKIDINLTLSHRFCGIRQKVTKQSLWSQATIKNIHDGVNDEPTR